MVFDQNDRLARPTGHRAIKNMNFLEMRHEVVAAYLFSFNQTAFRRTAKSSQPFANCLIYRQKPPPSTPAKRRRI